MFSFFFKRIEMSTKEKVVPPPDGSSLIFSKFCLCGHLFNKHCKGLLSMSSVTIWPSYHFHKWYYLSSYLYKVQKENSWNKDENNFEAAKSSFLHLDLFSTEVFVFASLKTSLGSVFLSCLACNAQGACEEGADQLIKHLLALLRLGQLDILRQQQLGANTNKGRPHQTRLGKAWHISCVWLLAVTIFKKYLESPE